MELKEIGKDLYDVSAWIDEGIGSPGTAERAANMQLAQEEYNEQVILDESHGTDTTN